jgi:hypothetical protein
LDADADWTDVELWLIATRCGDASKTRRFVAAGMPMTYRAQGRITERTRDAKCCEYFC